MAAEFDLINRHFRRAGAAQGSGVELGIGDDCALLSPTPGMQLAVSTDTLIEGVHFPAETSPADVGWKALAVNLSDLAAMGAQPRACLLALSLPSADENWVAEFARGFFELADLHACPLVGGDTTAMPPGAPRVLTVTVLGDVPADEALRRDGAGIGELVCISGNPGEAAAGLAQWLAGNRDKNSKAIQRLLRPTPRLQLGLALRGVATAMVDVSDGLLGDLGHILDASSRRCGVALGAELHLAALPSSPVLDAFSLPDARELLLNGGDDYELCFTVPVTALKALQFAAANAQVPVAVIGKITGDGRVRCLDASGHAWMPQRKSWQHFQQ
jgi:thiamine-monophosphate kinase